MQEDYEKSSKLMKKTANKSFEDIAKFHSIENVVGYQLLDKIPVIKTAKRANFYAYFQQLAKEFNRLKKWRDDE